MPDPIPESELLERIAGVLAASEGTEISRGAQRVSGTLTAIKAKWFLGGRKITSTVTCSLDPSSHEVHLKERATESSWGVPPPTFTVETSSQSGTRATITKTQHGVGGGGRLEFGRFREAVERAVVDADWKFVLELG